MKILVVDNYDSFTYNLVEVIWQDQPDVDIDVFRNDRIDMKKVHQYDKILLSPGPGIPKDAGLMPRIISDFSGQKPILGICLGHQAIGEHFGAQLRNIHPVQHGIQSQLQVDEHYLFDGIPRSVDIGRYHSWVVDDEGLPDCLEVKARTDDGQIMALVHKELNICGLQFHPESVMSKHGGKMLSNWILNS